MRLQKREEQSLIAAGMKMKTPFPANDPLAPDAIPTIWNWDLSTLSSHPHTNRMHESVGWVLSEGRMQPGREGGKGTESECRNH